MSSESYEPEPRHIWSLVIMQCIAQGILIPMLVTFLNPEPALKRPIGLKLYVIFVNALSLAQTIIIIFCGFRTIDAVPSNQIYIHTSPDSFVPLSSPFSFIAAGEYLGNGYCPSSHSLLFVVSLSSLITWDSNLADTSSAQKKKIAMALCISSSFTLEFLMTTTTTVFLCRTRTDRRATLSDSSFGGMNAKIFNLSLMISLLGQVYVRQKFDRSGPSQLPNVGASHGTMGIISEPVFARDMAQVVTFDDGQLPVSSRMEISTTDVSVDSLSSDHSKDAPEMSQVSVVKPSEDGGSYAIRLIQFPPEVAAPHKST
ncbi:hypothetical protein RhiXN_04766 [Rhizoctonia solani]|uniref:Uncharacterized protein n=2 Tax=Rhizoctonia solani TaxID=456999 RepID=A0A8H8SSN7_9AGAM|nr:uncharacterized protein RhiXN_04766 [Rhizoctonia solani]QRW16764.1 hypothetical protein RhiXN_04766 [Rhizoctonia solani]